MVKVYVNCSLSNAEFISLVNSDGSFFDSRDTEYECVGFWHPGGKHASEQWVRDHPVLASSMLDVDISSREPVPEPIHESSVEPAIADKLAAESRIPESAPEPTVEPVVVEKISPSVAAEEIPAASEEQEECFNSVDTEDIPAVTEEPEIVEAPEESVVTESVVDELDSLGLPEGCLDELRGEKLFTRDAILAHSDLSEIKGIGVKTREKILGILNEGE